MTLTPDILLAYADGRLNEDEAIRVESALLNDAEARETLRLIRASGAALARARAAYRDLQAFDGRATGDPVADMILGRVSDPAPEAAPEPVAMQAPVAVTGAPRMSSSWRMAAAAALLAIGVGSGLLASSVLFPPHGGPAGVPSWIVSVVEYQALYARATVETTRVTTQERLALQVHMTEAMQRSSDLLIPDLGAVGLEFRRGQVLDYHGWPLVQLVYLPTAGGRPIALCVKRFADEPSGRRFYEIDGTNVMQWARDGLEFVIVGDADEAAMTRAADETNAEIFETL